MWSLDLIPRPAAGLGTCWCGTGRPRGRKGGGRVKASPSPKSLPVPSEEPTPPEEESLPEVPETPEPAEEPETPAPEEPG